MPPTVVETMTRHLDREAHCGGSESADAAAAESDAKRRETRSYSHSFKQKARYG